MKEIEALQIRALAAMDRVASGLEKLQKAGVGSDSSALADALEEEKLANAQLKERLRALNTRHFDEIGALKEKLADTSERDALQARITVQDEAMARLDMDIQRLRHANDELRASNAALRAANEAGVGEPHLINKAMLAELEALRASRATDAAEAAALLAKLEPLLAAAQANGEDA